jgi:hypothetical protein
MITIQRTVATIREPAAVFAYLSDFTTAPQWDAGTVRCSLLSGDGGVGTSYLNTSRFLGRETELTYVVEEFEPYHVFVVKGSNTTVTSVDTMRLSAVGGGTEVSYTAEFSFSGAARWLEPLLRVPLNKLGDDAALSLTEALNRL